MQLDAQHSLPCEHSAWKPAESRGTGVFIPKSSNWRKKNKQRRLRSYNTITYRQLADERSPHQPTAQLQNSSRCWTWRKSRTMLQISYLFYHASITCICKCLYLTWRYVCCRGKSEWLLSLRFLIIKKQVFVFFMNFFIFG